MGLLGGLSPGGAIALGIVVGILSTSVQSVGLTLQRKSHILEDEKGPHDIRRPPYRRRRWQLGMGMFLIANILGSSIQISTLPLPVLSTLQAAGLVFNSICATIILGEPFTRWSLYGTTLVTSGAVLIAIFGAIPSPTHNLNELLVLMTRKAFVVWMILQGLFVVALAIAMDVVNAMSNLSHNSRFRLVRGIVYGLISGILSAHALLFAKSSVELIIKTVSDENQFKRWQSWMIVVALIALALCQLYYLHRGLKLVSTSVLYPLVFCIYNIVAILDGLIYFDQTSLISPLKACLITLGTVILLSGVLALSWRLSEEQHTPGVGQSTLAPGLGLVEDTEGEEESLLGSESAAEEASAGYDTFPTSNGETTPLTPTRKKSFRWAEHAEIWGELEDQDEPTTPIGRARSSTMPGRSESSPLLPPNRRSIGGAPVPRETSPSAESPRRLSRKRRKSTGFPGLVARRHMRRRSNSISESISGSIGNMLGLRWWRERARDVSGGSGRAPTSPLANRDDQMGDVDGSDNAGRRRNDSVV